MKNENIDKIGNIINMKNDDIEIFSLSGQEKIGKIVDVYDADTCKIIFFLDNKIVKFNCRLNGIDAPELRQSKKNPNRIIEKIKAKKARNRLIQLSTNINIQIEDNFSKKNKKELIDKNTKILKIKCNDFDKYGRLLVKLYDLENYNCINNILIEEGYAKHYNGGKKDKFEFNQIKEIDSDTDTE